MHKELKKKVVGTAEGNGTKTFDIEFPIDEVPPSHVDSDAIGIGYNIKIDVCRGLYEISVYLTLPYSRR